MRRVDVADFEARALAGQTTRSKGRQAALVGDLGERVRLVHELRELRRAEELLDRRDDGLGVDQVVRHGRVDVLMDRHLLFDRALHADEADAELVLEQLTDRADAAVAEVIDVVDAADVLAEAEQVVDDDVEVVRRHRLLRDRRIEIELDVELEAADAREVVLAGVEEHAFEQRLGRLERRRIARAHATVDLDDGRFERLRGVLADGVEQDVGDEIPLGEDHFDLVDAAVAERFRPIGRNVLAGLEEDFAGVEVDDVAEEHGLLERGVVDLHGRFVVLRQLVGHLLVELDAGEDGAHGAASADGVTLLRFFLIEDAAIERELGAGVLEAAP